MPPIADFLRDSDRGASEVLGVLLLTGIVILALAWAGTAILTEVTAKSNEDQTLVDCRIAYADDGLTVTHHGGESVEATELSVILKNESTYLTRLPLAIDEGDGDALFEPGEVARLGSLAGETEVMVATANTVLCNRLVRPSGTTGPSTPTATPTPTPTATPTPTPTTTATPANFAVSITGTNSPVRSGTTLSVTVQVENTGGTAATQTIQLAVDKNVGVVDSEPVTLSSGGSTTITLTWNVPGGAHSKSPYTVTASSSDSSASTQVVVTNK